MIDADEWHTNLRKLGIAVEMTEGRALFDKLDSDGSGSVSTLHLVTLQNSRACPAFAETSVACACTCPLLQLETKELQKQSRVLKLLFMCLQCMLACLQRFVEYISRMAYIVIAIKGTASAVGVRH